MLSAIIDQYRSNDWIKGSASIKDVSQHNKHNKHQ